MIVEPTSGNTGIGLAFTCAARGYRLMVTMPESMSLERRRLLKAFGAEIVLTSGGRGNARRGAQGRRTGQEHAQRLHAPAVQEPGQPRNPPPDHRRGNLAGYGGEVDILVAGVGTGGTITGCGEVLKSRKPVVEVIAVEPAGTPVISQLRLTSRSSRAAQDPGHRRGVHSRGAQPRVIDEVIAVRDDEAFETARQLAREEGLLCGICCGAAVAGLVVARAPENAGKLIVAILPDLGERYLSTPLFPE